MGKVSDNIHVGKIPDFLSAASAFLGRVNAQGKAKASDSMRAAVAVEKQGDGFLFCVRSDLTLDAEPAEVWLVVSKTAVSAFMADGKEYKPVMGPFELAKVEKVRMFQTVGSAFLQLMVGGVYVSVVRFSNAYRVLFGRARVQIERLTKGEPFQPEALTMPIEGTCPKCGMPVPGKDAKCLRCEGGHGVLVRAIWLMRPYSRFIAVLFGMMIIRVILGLVPPYLTEALVDKVLTGPKLIGWLKWILLALVALAAGQCVLNVLIGRSSSIIGTQITKELREVMGRRLIGLNVEYYDKHSVGSLMSRVLYDVDYFQGFVTQVSQGFLLNVMLVLGIGAVLFYKNWRLAFLVLLPIPLVVVGTTFFWEYIYPRYFKVWDSQSKMSQHLSGLFSGVRLVKAFGQEHRELDRLSKQAGYLQQSRRGMETSVATFNPIMAFIFGLGGLIIWYAGGRMVLDEKITLGRLMAFFAYIGMFYGPVSQLTMFSNWMTGFVSAGQRVFEILDATTTIKDSPQAVHMPEIQGAIEFKNVTFGYDPHSPVLKNVSLKIRPGQFIGVVGKSGSGKTTLVNLICRFYDVQTGQVLIDNVDVREIAHEELHQQVALVLQEPFLFRDTVRDNVVYGKPDASDTEVLDAARAANAHVFISKMPAAYDHKLGERGAGLSGGEKQRVTIARALIRDPKILILDEATSSVDTESEQEIQKALSILGKGRTTVVIAHRLSTLKSADYIYLMDDGKVAEEGTHDELLAKEGIYYKLVKIQTELARLEV